MRIGLDARTMTMPRPRGTGRCLLDVYRRLPPLRPDWEFVLYHQRTVPLGVEHEALRHPNVTLRCIDIPGDRINAWFQVRLPAAALLDRIDLLHLPANAAPVWCPVPAVVTIHDLTPLKIPGEVSMQTERRFRRGVQRAVRHAVHLITVSQATREALRERFGVSAERVTVIPWAADSRIARQGHRPLDEDRRAALRAKYELGPRWLMHFAGSTPRKNAAGVLAALEQMTPARRHGVQVVLVGTEPAAYRQELAKLAERLGVAAHCRILGFVEFADLPALLHGACGLLMPSRDEGFGLPILDAFACGVPVLTANVSSMPEVAGDAAVYCDPDDARSIAQGIERLLDPPTAADLVERGRARLGLFTWEHTAETLAAVYDACLSQRKGARGRRTRGAAALAPVGPEDAET